VSVNTSTVVGESLRGARAFSIVVRALAGEPAEPTPLAEPAFARLLSALCDPALRPSPLDLAVLVRHALRHHQMQPEGSGSGPVFVRGGPTWPTPEDWARVDADATPTSGGYLVAVRSWRPEWLDDAGLRGVDGAAAQASERRALRAVPGDPFLARFGRTTYHSSGQRAAMRAALMAPPGATLLVCLPTGEGKSAIFQTIAEYGFGDDQAGGPGVTLVITPTVTLVLDHERAALDLGLDDIPRAYVGGSGHSVANQALAERIADGSQGLCFASPEAACGPLRPALVRAARAGYLRALVVDEAHLVDAWGTNFRSEFQVLSGVRHDLLREQGAGVPFRTVLLSATVTPQAEVTLRTLFATDADGHPGNYAISAAVRLRAEIEYWVAPLCPGDERRARVLEAACHLPRPAILYTTQVADAERWHRELKDIGFRRIACVTGSSDAAARQSVVERWRDGTVDLVVGTSAFGLGIDNPHVRTVIHACVPETLDRFYQEVGRGGRDGRACISLLIPTEEDLRIASGLNKRRTITVERGLRRWTAMFTHPDSAFQGGNTFTLRLDVAPGYDERDIDMLSERNTDWNTRTLTLMAAAGLVTLRGSGLPVNDDAGLGSAMAEAPAAALDGDAAPRGVYQTVTVNDPRHLEVSVWQCAVEPCRAALAKASRASLEQMRSFLAQAQCAAETLAPQYELDPSQAISPEAQACTIPAVHVARACGGCHTCRMAGRLPYSEHPVETPYPWPAPPPPADFTDATNRLIIYYPSSAPVATRSSDATPRVRRREREALAALLRGRVREVIALPGSDLDLEGIQRELPGWALFTSDQLVANRLPPGLALVVVPPGMRLTAQRLAPRPPEQARVFLLPDDVEDPSRPGVPLRETYGGRELTWDDVLRELHR
jgi:ATP-dependent DNA helicase RecQ